MHRRLALAACLCLAAAACGGGDTDPVPANNKLYDVFTIGDAFSPSTLAIAVGDTVRFNFSGGSDGMGHDVTFRATPGAPANINVTKTGTASRVFANRGTFHYDCFVHPGMQGDIIVQ
jgi:plastocyanin